MSNQSNLKQLCFSFKGRINRTIFWGSTLVVFFSLAVLYKGIQNIPIFALLYVCIPIWVKRLHDLNKSGMLLLWGGIPIVCYILFWVSSIRAFMWASILFAIAGYLYIIIACGCLKGTAEANVYGAVHPEAQITNKINWKDPITGLVAMILGFGSMAIGCLFQIAALVVSALIASFLISLIPGC